MGKLKKAPSKKEREEKAQKFVDESDVGTNAEKFETEAEKEEKETVEHYTTTLYPSYIEKIKALAYDKRCSQREVIEDFIDGEGYSQEEIRGALKIYREYTEKR